MKHTLDNRKLSTMIPEKREIKEVNPGFMFGSFFSILVQCGGTQPEHSEPIEMRRKDPTLDRTEAARLHKAQYWRRENYTEKEF